MQIQRSYSGAPWEEEIGYCRAIRAGNHVFVTGTAPITEDGTVYAPGDGEAQARRCLEIIAKALREVGADMKDVVRTRMFTTDMARWREYGHAHAAFFREHPPATTLVEVKSLIESEMLIEIEAEAICAG